MAHIPDGVLSAPVFIVGGLAAVAAQGGRCGEQTFGGLAVRWRVHIHPGDTAHVNRGPVYRFNMNHVVIPDDPYEMFRNEMVEV